MLTIEPKAAAPIGVSNLLFCLASLIQPRPWTVNPPGVRSRCDLCAFAFEVTAAGPRQTGAIERGSAPPTDGAAHVA